MRKKSFNRNQILHLSAFYYFRILHSLNCKVLNQNFWSKNLVFTITGYTGIRKFHYKLSRKQKLFARKKLKTFPHFHKTIFTLIQRGRSKFPWIEPYCSKFIQTDNSWKIYFLRKETFCRLHQKFTSFYPLGINAGYTHLLCKNFSNVITVKFKCLCRLAYF